MLSAGELFKNLESKQLCNNYNKLTHGTLLTIRFMYIILYKDKSNGGDV